MGMSNMPIGGGRQDYSRILVIVTNGMRHPLFVSFFGRETRSSGEAENDWKEHKAVQGSRNDERNPHPEVVDLKNFGQTRPQRYLKNCLPPVSETASVQAHTSL